MMIETLFADDFHMSFLAEYLTDALSRLAFITWCYLRTEQSTQMILNMKNDFDKKKFISKVSKFIAAFNNFKLTVSFLNKQILAIHFTTYAPKISEP